MNLLPLSNPLVETSLVLGVTLLVAHAMSPYWRVLLYRCAAVVALLIPLLFLTSAPKAALLHIDVAQPTIEAERLRATEPMAEAFREPSARSAPTVAKPAARYAPDWPLLLLILWLAGTARIVVRYLVSLKFLIRAAREGASPAPEWQRILLDLQRELGVNGQVRLCITRSVRTPCTFGSLRPTILIPATSAYTDAMSRAVLAHELCHIRRRDTLWIALTHVACAVHWFNPLIWLCARNLRDETEIVSDAIACNSAGGAASYATALIEAARRTIAPVPAGLSMSSHGVAARIRRLIEQETDMHRPTLAGKTVLLSAVAAALTLFGTTELVAARTVDDTMLTAVIAGQKDSANPDVHTMLAEATAHGGVLYLNVRGPAKVWGRQAGLMCGDDAKCMFTLTPGTDLTLTAEGHAMRWKGCEAAADGLSCRVHVPEGSVRIDASAD